MNNNINLNQKIDERNHFLIAQDTSDQRFSHLFERMKALKFMNFLLLILLILMSLIFLGLMKKPKVIPYLVEITPEGRIANYGKVLNFEDNNIDPVMAEYYIKRFIKNIRLIDFDAVVIKRQWQEAYAFTTNKSSKILNKMFVENKPLEVMKTNTITLSFISYLEKAKNSREVEWVEKIFDHQGYMVGQKRYRALLNFGRSKNIIGEENPSGFYIDSFIIGEIRE